jgi:hypothetical protein
VNTVNSNTGGTAIAGANSRSFTPDVSVLGTFYYYVEVRNTNNTVNGTKTAAVTSEWITVQVE